jgi:hypothetical protein
MMTMAVLQKGATSSTEHSYYINGTTPSSVPAGNFITGVEYVIETLGNTDFTLIGADINIVGSTFIATGPGAGSGTATTTVITVDTQNNTFHLAQNVKILLNVFPISPDLLQSMNFTYLVSGAVAVISGPDDSPNSNTLRFSISNKISVYVNGVLVPDTQYIISITNQSITFTPAIFESNNVVNVIVYNDLTANVLDSSIIPLEFVVLDPSITTSNGTSPLTLLSGDAWGNYNAVTIPTVGTRYLMYCSQLDALINDYSYGVKGAQVVIGAVTINAGSFVVGTTYQITSIGTTDFTAIGANSNTIGIEFTATGAGTGTGTATIAVVPIDISLSEIFFVVAKDPYNFQDKDLNVYLSGSVIDSTFTFTYAQEPFTGLYEFSTAQSRLTQLLHPLTPSDPSDPALFNVPTITGTPAVTVVTHKYVLGPT